MRFKKFSAWSKDGNIEFLDVLLPVKRVVCPRCDGSGRHVNPSIDGHGIGAEEFDENPDFRENYFSGLYDVRCEECRGENVVDILDDDLCRTRLSWFKGMLRHKNHLRQMSESYWESEYERRAPA